jgi:hypothetical protein
MKCFFDDHCGGVSSVPKSHQDEVRAVIEAVCIKPMRGAASDFRDSFNRGLHAKGWSSSTALSKESRISISSTKGSTGLCMQTGGNMSRMYADLLKLQHLYVTDKISCGIMIVPSKNTAKLLGDNVVHASRLVQELGLFNKVVHIPMVVFSFE